MGHSFGGVIVQILLDHGLGAAGVAIDSGAPEGIRAHAFANTLREEESAKVYGRYHVPAPGRFIWDGVLANFTPGHQDAYVAFHNDDRAPLGRAHYTLGQDGWEEVADYALDWALTAARREPVASS
jgi:hypothetical protein